METEKTVPDKPGYYSIWVDKANSLPEPFSTELRIRKSNLLYIGIASGSLKSRLVEQELQHKKPATFFRSLGAVLGYRPAKGSLANKTNKSNYRFSISDSEEIKEWIKRHLKIQFASVDIIERNIESTIIRESVPLFNGTHNPKKSGELSKLRSECRRIAR